MSKTLNEKISFWYYWYLLHTGLYMLESWERSIFNTVIIAFIATATYTAYLFMPGHILTMSRFLMSYFYGNEVGNPST